MKNKLIAALIFTISITSCSEKKNCWKFTTTVKETISSSSCGTPNPTMVIETKSCDLTEADAETARKNIEISNTQTIKYGSYCTITRKATTTKTISY